MPKLRRLTGNQVIRTLSQFGFEVYSQRGSHVRLQRVTESGEQQRLVIAVHAGKTVPLGTLHSIYVQAIAFVHEDDLRPLFYTD